MKPRNIKQALEQGYVISKVDYECNKDVRVTLTERYHKPDREMFLQFWINKKFFERYYKTN